MPKVRRNFGGRTFTYFAFLLFGGVGSFVFSPRHVPAAEPIDVHGKITLPDGSAGRFAAVWLEGNTHAVPLKNATIDQRGKTFIPHILIVTPGTRVNFPNNDTVFHNVFAFFEAKRFDIGMYPRGESRQVTFDKPGIVSVLCNVHPKMSAFIVIVDTPYYSVASRSGEFHVSGIPPGKYTLKAWHESGATWEHSINIGTDTTPLTISLERR